MSTPIPHESGDPSSSDDFATLQRVKGRIRRVEKMLAWQANTRLALARAELENAQLRAQLAVAEYTIQALQYGIGLDPALAPPHQLVTAWHTGSADCIPVFLVVDGVEWLILVDGAPRVPNPVREYEDWQRMKESLRRADKQVNDRHSTTEGEQ